MDCGTVQTLGLGLSQHGALVRARRLPALGMFVCACADVLGTCLQLEDLGLCSGGLEFSVELRRSPVVAGVFWRSAKREEVRRSMDPHGNRGWEGVGVEKSAGRLIRWPMYSIVYTVGAPKWRCVGPKGL